MDDLISRQAAIDAIMSEPPEAHYPSWYADILKELPSAQPERLTDDDFETIRIHLNAYKEKLCNQRRWEEAEEYQRIIDRFMAFASAQPERASCKQVTGKLDLISRQDAIDAIVKCTNCNTPKDLREYVAEHSLWSLWSGGVLEALEAVEGLPSAEPERYTKEELRVFQHGISLRLLSKRSAQHWRYDEDTATEIKFLERLYEKVGADIRGEEV